MLNEYKAMVSHLLDGKTFAQATSLLEPLMGLDAEEVIYDLMEEGFLREEGGTSRISFPFLRSKLGGKLV